MLHLREKLNTRPAAIAGGRRETSLTLAFEDRRKSRLRVCLDDGQEAAVLLPRGTVLRQGDYLIDDEGRVLVAVKAGLETLSVAHTEDRRLLTRAAYHLGNRHVALQVGLDWLAYEHDHVLDGMVGALGLAVAVERRPFEPEAGGYGPGHGDNHELEPDYARPEAQEYHDR